MDKKNNFKLENDFVFDIGPFDIEPAEDITKYNWALLEVLEDMEEDEENEE